VAIHFELPEHATEFLDTWPRCKKERPTMWQIPQSGKCAVCVRHLANWQRRQNAKTFKWQKTFEGILADLADVKGLYGYRQQVIADPLRVEGQACPDPLVLTDFDRDRDEVVVHWAVVQSTWGPELVERAKQAYQAAEERFRGGGRTPAQ
jgi:hypothetical protein